MEGLEPALVGGGGEAQVSALEAHEADVRALCREMDSVVELQNSFQEEPRFSPKLAGLFSPEVPPTCLQPLSLITCFLLCFICCPSDCVFFCLGG